MRDVRSKRRKLTRLSGGAPQLDVNSLWCRGLGEQLWKFELLLDEAEGEHWTYRRNPHVRRELRTVVNRSPEGIPYLAPEIQLLYKAKSARPRDAADFEAVVPHLSVDARAWLRQSLASTLPSHPWTPKLECHREA